VLKRSLKNTDKNRHISKSTPWNEFEKHGNNFAVGVIFTGAEIEKHIISKTPIRSRLTSWNAWLMPNSMRTDERWSLNSFVWRSMSHAGTQKARLTASWRADIACGGLTGMVNTSLMEAC
jgi:hypothetical protein